MPSLRPRTSWAPLADLSHAPACILTFFSGSRRASEMISATASSTTERVLENGAFCIGTNQVDLVGADAERADGEQVGRGGEHALGDLGLGTDAEQAEALHLLDELVFP